MNIDLSIESKVKNRYRVRNYSEKEIPADNRSEIVAFISLLDNSFGKKVNFNYLNKKNIENEKILGTYGFIKGDRQ